MNPIMNSSKKIIRMIDVRKLSFAGKTIQPCGQKCLCFMFLDLSEKRSQIYYDHCYRTKMKMHH